MTTLYTTHCPKCRVLQKKMEEKGIEFNICDNMDEILSLGVKFSPILKIENGDLLNFEQSWDWTNKKD